MELISRLFGQSNFPMDEESYRMQSAINEVTQEILASYDDTGKTDEEVRAVVKDAIEAEGGEQGMGSLLLWVNYVKTAVLKRALDALQIERPTP